MGVHMRRLLVILGVLALAVPALADPELKNVPGCRINTLAATSGGCFEGGPTSGSLVWVLNGDPSATGDAMCSDPAEAGEAAIVSLCRYTGASWVRQDIASQTTGAGGGTPDDDSVTDPKMGADDFGDFSCAGTAESCTVDAGVIVNADVNGSAAIDATKIGAGGVTSTEFGYIGGLTSDAQTQIDAKAATADILTASQVWRADAATAWTTGAVTASDGTFLDLSAINASGTSEGLKLPQSTSCTSATAQGQTCWDTTHKMFFIGDGTTALPAGMEVLYFYYYHASAVTTTLFGSDDLLGIYASSTTTRNTGQTLRYVESLYQLGATGAQAFVHKIQCNLAPIGSSAWTNGSDSVALQVVEMDAASATAMTTIGSPATLSGTVTVAPNPFLAGNVVSSTINAFTTLTGGAHYIGINPVLTDADNGVIGLAIQCSVWLKRTL